MQIVELPAKQRTKLGSKGANDARRAESIPAIVYGHGITPVAVAVPEKLFVRSLHGEHGSNVFFDLKVEGAKLKETTCRVKDYQVNPVTDKISHVDFMIFSMNEKIEVQVPLKMKGADLSPGIKAGGVLDLVHHEIEIECLPKNIPDFIEIDVKALNIGDAIHLKDIKLPEGATSAYDADEVLVALHAPKIEEAPAAEGEEGAKEPEVLTAKKKEEGAEGAAADAKAAPAAPKAEKK